MAEALRLNTTKWDRSLAVLGQRAHVAQVRALKRAGVSARAAMVPAMATDVALKQGEIREEIRIDQSRIEGEHMVQLVIAGKPLPLITWVRNPQPGVRRRGGVTAKLPPPGAGRYPNAFVARMRSGHVGVFERNAGENRRGPKPNRSQLGIHELFGVSLVYVFQKYRPLGAEAGVDSLIKNLEHELEWALEQARQAA